MTTTQITSTESLIILAAAGAEGALAEYAERAGRELTTLLTARDALVEMGLIELEDGEYFPTVIAIELAQAFETDQVRAAAVAR